MCLFHRYSFGLCNHRSYYYFRACSEEWRSDAEQRTAPENCECKEQIWSQTSLDYEFCNSCFLKSELPDVDEAKHFKYYSGDMNRCFGSDDILEAEQIFNRVKAEREYEYRLSDIISSTNSVQSAATSGAVSALYWYLINYFWYLRKCGRSKRKLRQLIIRVRTNVLVHHNNTLYFEHFPPPRREFLIRTVIIPVEQSNEELGDDNSICPITSERYREDVDGQPGDVPVRLICDAHHMFGKEAILMWLGTTNANSNNTCPLCRQEVIPEFVDRDMYKEYVGFSLRAERAGIPQPTWLVALLGPNLVHNRYSNALLSGFLFLGRYRVEKADPASTEGEKLRFLPLKWFNNADEYFVEYDANTDLKYSEDPENDDSDDENSEEDEEAEWGDDYIDVGDGEGHSILLED